jgi:hypothetical protein
MPAADESRAELTAQHAETLKARLTALRAEIEEREQAESDVERELIALALQALPPERRPARPVMDTWGWGCTPDLTPQDREAAAYAEPDEDEDDDDEDEAEDENYPDTANVAGFCIYDDDADPCHDCCLFCGQPEERK